jgi:haloalkane dehalogenase
MADTTSEDFFNYERKKVNLESGDISYIEEGSGLPVLLLHGAPITALGFVRVIDVLKRNYRVIAPDFPGFGYSRAAPAFEENLECYAAFVSEFCENLNLTNLYVYLNDSSACIGLYSIADQAARVAGLIIADTVPLPLTGRASIVKFFLKYVVTSPPVRFLNRKFNLLPWLVVAVAPFKNPFSGAERRALIKQFDTKEKRDRILNIFSHMARDEHFMRATAEKTAESLKDIPVLLLYGQFDPMRLAGGISRFRKMFHNSETVIISLEEHFPILASGEIVGLAINEWIERTKENKK